jgi:hypothetical protein
MSVTTSSSSGPFALRTVLIIIAIGGVAIAGLVYLSLYGRDYSEPLTVQANTFSRSSIGHKAFFQTLRELGIAVQLSRFATIDKTGPSDLLVVAEPSSDSANSDLLESLESMPQALLVLPKWKATPRGSWAASLYPVDREQVLSVYGSAIGEAKLVRHTGTAILPAGRFFEGAIKLSEPQYIVDEELTPLIAAPDGILLGEYAREGHRLWVLADPDLISNQGIDEADNAAVAVAILLALQKPGGLVIFDETVHGFGQSPTLLRKVFQLPYVIVTVTAAIAVLLLIWAGSTRFGAAQPNELVLAAGKGTLIRNAAALLSIGKSVGMVLSTYLRIEMNEAMRELRGPDGLDEAGQTLWLDRQAERRGLGLRLAPRRDAALALAQSPRPDMRQALRLAIDLHQWKQEMLNGTGSRSGAG